MSIAALIVVSVVLVGLLVIPLLVGLYVYRDAAARGMNATLWTLVALAAPALVGLIIYLTVRGDTPRSQCSVCQAPVTLNWRYCPQCAAPLPADFPTTPKKDRGLGAILALVCLAPLAVLAVLALSYTSAGAGVSTTTLTADDYLQEMDNPQIAAWLDSCKGGEDAAYILQSGQELGPGQYRSRYLIYIPGLRWDTELDMSQDSGLFGTSLKLDLAGGSGSQDAVLLVTCTGENTDPRLVITLDGQRLPCRYTHVEYPLGLTDVQGNS